MAMKFYETMNQQLREGFEKQLDLAEEDKDEIRTYERYVNKLWEANNILLQQIETTNGERTMRFETELENAFKYVKRYQQTNGDDAELADDNTDLKCTLIKPQRIIEMMYDLQIANNIKQDLNSPEEDKLGDSIMEHRKYLKLKEEFDCLTSELKREKKKCESFAREVLIISSHKSPIDNITIGGIEAESSTALVRHNSVPYDAEHPYDLNDFSEKQQSYIQNTIAELKQKYDVLLQNISISPFSITPPKTPELKQSDSCNTSDVENNLTYRNVYLTVPGQIPIADYSDTDQDSNITSSEMNIDYYDPTIKDEIERLNQIIFENEGENSCNQLLIQKLEEKVFNMRKSNDRIKYERDLKHEKLHVLKQKLKLLDNQVLQNPNLTSEHHIKCILNDLGMVEEELKPEYEIMSNLKRTIETTRQTLNRVEEEKDELIGITKRLKEDLNKFRYENKVMSIEIDKLKNKESSDKETSSAFYDNACLKNNTGSVLLSRLMLKDEEVNKIHETIANVFTKALGKEIPIQTIKDLASPNSSGDGNGHAFSELISDWKRELEVKSCQLKEKTTRISSLEVQLQSKDEEIFEVRERCASVEKDRDGNCQTIIQQKSAIETHKESIEFLRKQIAELQSKSEENQKVNSNHQEYFKSIDKRNIQLESENQHSVIETLNVSVNLLSEQLNECFKEAIQKEEQLERLRDANLQLRSQVFGLNQDVEDIMEIVEIQKNRRTLEEYKSAQKISYTKDLEVLKEQERDIEKEIKNRENNINCLKHFRGRCAEIECEYLEKMNAQKQKSDVTIKELETEITTLTEQLIQSHQQTSCYEELMKETNILQCSMEELENQNDVLRKTIEAYESRFSDIQVQLEKIHFENGSLINEIENLKSDVNDKNKRIAELSLDHHKLEAEYDMKKKSCNCSPKTSPEKARSSSTVIQINDLKTKLMNKSVEHSKVAEALKRKSQQYEKLQKTAFEEKNRLREECLKSIQTIGELKSKISMLEVRVQEQNEELVNSREKVSHTLAKMCSMETDVQSNSAKLEDLQAREEKWRTHAYEITHEIKNRKEDAFKREQKLIHELNTKSNAMKDQIRIIQTHESNNQRWKEENECLKESQNIINQRASDLKLEVEELRRKEAGLTDLLGKTEDELKVIKKEVFQLFNTNVIPEIKTQQSQMKVNNLDLQSKYEILVSDYNKLIDENRTLYEIKNDTIQAIEIFKKLQEESTERERAYQSQIGKLTADKRNLHKDRTRLTKQLLNKHRDMIILNSEIDKFKDDNSDDQISRPNSNYNSLQPFQPVFYPSDMAGMVRSSSNPDLATDPIVLDARSITDKMQRTRKFWSHGIRTAISSITTVPPSQPKTTTT